MNILELLLFCFFLKKSTGVDVFIIDIPEKDLNDGNESEYVYYDYEQALAPNLVKNKPLPVNNLGLSQAKEQYQKGLCDRFGSMYGINPNKHKCENLRDDNKKQLINAPIFLKPVQFKQFKPFFLNQREKRKRKHDLTRGDDFSLDYVDDYWRTRPDMARRCNLNDIVTNRCNLRKRMSNQRLVESSEFSESDDSESNESDETPNRKKNKKKRIKYSSEIEEDLPKRKKPNRFKVITKPKEPEFTKKIEKFNNKQSSSETESVESEEKTIQKVSNKKIEPYKSVSEPLTETEEEEEEEKEEEDNQEDSLTEIEKGIVEYKAPLTEEEEVIQGDPLKEFEEEEMIEGDPLTELEEEEKEDTTIENSFEENQPSSKYKYLQGHRMVNGRDFRRSRMQTFLPKRNTWTAKDIPKLGFFWFDGGPKGIFKK